MELAFIPIVIIALALLALKRSNAVYRFEMRLLAEESKFLDKRISERKGYDGHRRYDATPSSYKMWLQFWKPLKKYEKPLKDYYED